MKLFELIENFKLHKEVLDFVIGKVGENPLSADVPFFAPIRQYLRGEGVKILKAYLIKEDRNVLNKNESLYEVVDSSHDCINHIEAIVDAIDIKDRHLAMSLINSLYINNLKKY